MSSTERNVTIDFTRSGADHLFVSGAMTHARGLLATTGCAYDGTSGHEVFDITTKSPLTEVSLAIFKGIQAGLKDLGVRVYSSTGLGGVCEFSFQHPEQGQSSVRFTVSESHL